MLHPDSGVPVIVAHNVPTLDESSSAIDIPAKRRSNTDRNSNLDHSVGGELLLEIPEANPRIGYACLLQDLRSSVPLLISDLSGILAAWAITFIICQTVGIHNFPGYRSLAALLVIIPLGFLFSQLYPASVLHPAVEIGRIFTSVSLVFLGLFATTVITSDRPIIACMGRALQLGLMISLIPAFRLAIRSVLSRGSWWRQPTLVIGSQSEYDMLSNWINSQWYLGIKAVNYFQSDKLLHHPTRVIVAPSMAFQVNFDGDIAWKYPRAIFAPEYIKEFPMLISGVVEGSTFSGAHQQNRLCSPIQRWTKRCIDLWLVICFLPVWLPLFLAIAVAVKLSSRGPIIYGQKRLGRNGRHFTAWKFRTMVADADAVLKKYLEEHPELKQEWLKDHKLKFDPRVTSLGRLLRKTSLDEIPQLLNVILGQMSLVGPRPIVDDEIEKYNRVYRQYSRVKPGVTGLWQISGRNDTTYSERVRLDDFYVRNWSIWMDVFILFRTVKTVLLREGAY